jgi:sugar phosphate isomerase/epimerase
MVERAKGRKKSRKEQKVKLSFVVRLDSRPRVWKAQVGILAACGFNGCELSTPEPEAVDVRILKSVLKKGSLGVSGLATGLCFVNEGLSLTSLDSAIRAKALKRLCAYLALAKKLDTRVIIGLIRGKSTIQRASSTQRFLKEGMRKVCAEAERLAVDVLIEPINRYETVFLNRIDETVDFIRSLKSNRVAVLIDTFHMNIEEKDVSATIKKYSRYIKHVHFADSNRLVPGAGHIDFQSIVKALKAVHYNGYITGEINALRGFKKDALSFFHNVRRYR